MEGLRLNVNCVKVICVKVTKCDPFPLSSVCQIETRGNIHTHTCIFMYLYIYIFISSGRCFLLCTRDGRGETTGATGGAKFKQDWPISVSTGNGNAVWGTLLVRDVAGSSTLCFVLSNWVWVVKFPASSKRLNYSSIFKSRVFFRIWISCLSCLSFCLSFRFRIWRTRRSQKLESAISVGMKWIIQMATRSIWSMIRITGEFEFGIGAPVSWTDSSPIAAICYRV